MRSNLNSVIVDGVVLNSPREDEGRCEFRLAVRKGVRKNGEWVMRSIILPIEVEDARSAEWILSNLKGGEFVRILGGIWREMAERTVIVAEMIQIFRKKKMITIECDGFKMSEEEIGDE